MLQTEDLYLAAYALTRGAELKRLRVRLIGSRRLAVFHIEGGEDLDQVEDLYWRGEAVANLTLLKFHLRRLKDRAWDAVREEERRGHATGEAGGHRPHR